MSKSQYAEIPIKYLEIMVSPKNNFSYLSILLSKLKLFNIFSLLRKRTVIVKIMNDRKPFVEEIMTKNKIGLNKNDGYNIYLKGNVIYSLCTKSEAYAKMYQNIHYKETIKRIFRN